MTNTTKRDNLTKKVSTPAEVRQLIELKAGEGWTPAEILHHLERSEWRNWVDQAGDPLRTIERIAVKNRRDASEAFTPSTVARALTVAEIAPLVTEVIPAVIEQTGGRVTVLSTEEARYVAAIRVIAPDCPPMQAFRLSRAYIARGRKPTSDLDMQVMYRPWASEIARSSYTTALMNGHVAPPPSHLLMGVAQDFVMENLTSRKARRLAGDRERRAARRVTLREQRARSEVASIEATATSLPHQGQDEEPELAALAEGPSLVGETAPDLGLSKRTTRRATRREQSEQKGDSE